MYKAATITPLHLPFLDTLTHIFYADSLSLLQEYADRETENGRDFVSDSDLSGPSTAHHTPPKAPMQNFGRFSSSAKHENQLWSLEGAFGVQGVCCCMSKGKVLDSRAIGGPRGTMGGPRGGTPTVRSEIPLTGAVREFTCRCPMLIYTA